MAWWSFSCATALVLAPGCYASHRRAEVTSFDSASRDASRVLDDAGRDDAARDDAFALDAASVEGGAPDVPLPDAGMPRCDPTTVVWASPPPFVCGSTTTPRIDAVNLDGWGGHLSASSCGLGLLLHHEYSLIGGLAGPTTQSVELRTYDGALVWSAADSLTEGWSALVTLPDGSIVLSGRIGFDYAWILRSAEGEVWRAVPPGIVYGPAPRTEDVDTDGTLHVFLQTTRPDFFGLPETGEDVYIDLAMDEAGGVEVTELARGAFRWIDAVRTAPALHVQVVGATRWLDGTITATTPWENPIYLRIEGGTVGLREERDHIESVYGHADGSSTGNHWSEHENVVTHRGADGAVLWRWSEPRRPGGEVSMNDFALQPDGRMLVGGRLEGTVSLGGRTYTSVGRSDGFLVELDPCGALAWVRVFPASGDYDHILDLSVQPDGRAVGILETGGLVDIDGVTVGDAMHYRSVLLTISDLPP
jgi:hypothetical protein